MTWKSFSYHITIAGALASLLLPAQADDAAPAPAATPLAATPLNAASQIDLTRAQSDSGHWTETPLWSNAPLTAPANGNVSGRDLVNGLSAQMPILNRLRDWRDTLAGRGTAPRRIYRLASDQPLQLVVGAQALPGFDNSGLGTAATGASLQYGNVTLGTTMPAGLANGAFRSYDALMNGASLDSLDNPIAVDESRLNWLAARPLAGKSGSIDLLAAQGRRDLTPGQVDNKTISEGALWGARGEMALMRRWKMRGEWMQSVQETGDVDATAWKVNLDGTLRHPWGEAKVSAGWSDVGTGYAPFWNGGTGGVGHGDGRIAVQQDVALGALSGTTNVAVTETQRPDQAVAGTDTPRREDGIEGSANLRWNLSPSLSITARHDSRDTTSQRIVPAPAPVQPSVPDASGATTGGDSNGSGTPVAGGTPDGSNADGTGNPAPSDGTMPTTTPVTTPEAPTPSVPDGSTPNTPAPDTAVQVSTVDNHNSDIGLELKMSRSLTLAVGAGLTSAGSQTLAPGQDAPAVDWLHNENRLTAALARHTPGGAWSLQWSHQDVADQQGAPPSDADGVPGNPMDTLNQHDTQGLRVEAERQLFSFLRIKGAWHWNGGEDATSFSGAADRSMEAQFALSSLGRFAVRYSDWAQHQDTLDPAGSSSVSGAREYGVRYNIGKGDGQAGLGFSVEWARRSDAAPTNSTWRVGLTYR